MITVGVSFARAKAIKSEGATFSKWCTKARMRGVSETTIKRVYDQWKDNAVKLILTVEEWSEIQLRGGE
jgi:hypothetical protein